MNTPCYAYNAFGFKSEVLSFQQLFQEICPTESLTDEAEEVLSNIVHYTLATIVKGSCKLASHRNSDHLGLHDVALFLRTQLNMDPLLLSGVYYYATEHTVEPEVPIVIPPPKKGRRGRPPKLVKSPENCFNSLELREKSSNSDSREISTTLEPLKKCRRQPKVKEEE